MSNLVKGIKLVLSTCCEKTTDGSLGKFSKDRVVAITSLLALIGFYIGKEFYAKPFAAADALILVGLITAHAASTAYKATNTPS